MAAIAESVPSSCSTRRKRNDRVPLNSRKIRRMDSHAPRPGTQPFSCHICNLNFSGGKALALHMQEKHEPNWTAADKAWLKSIRISVEE